MDEPAFGGFPPETLSFLSGLRANNNRDWFTANKAVYERAMKRPAEAFAPVLAERLTALAGQPMRGKIFRIYRDVRFSKDKSPYNAHLHIGFMPPGEGRHRAGYYFGLDADGLALGGGTVELSGPDLDAFRSAMADDRTGGALARLVADLRAQGFRIDDGELKRVPAPYPADHPRGELLRHKSLSAWKDVKDPAAITGPSVVETCMAAFEAMAPLNRWIEDALA